MVVAIRPGGNQVRTYLDLLAPDSTTPDEIDDALNALMKDLDQRKNPTLFELGDITMRFGVELALEDVKFAQFNELASQIRALARLPRPGA